MLLYKLICNFRLPSFPDLFNFHPSCWVQSRNLGFSFSLDVVAYFFFPSKFHFGFYVHLFKISSLSFVIFMSLLGFEWSPE